MGKGGTGIHTVRSIITAEALLRLMGPSSPCQPRAPQPINPQAPMPAESRVGGVSERVANAGLTWDSEEFPVIVYGSMSHFHWSPDNRLLFVAYRDGQWDLFQSDTKGLDQVRLTSDSRVEDPGVWFGRHP